jgi:hypothetical protein
MTELTVYFPIVGNQKLCCDTQCTVKLLMDEEGCSYVHKTSAFLLRARRGARIPKHFVNLMGESTNFKMLEFPLNQLQMYYGYLCDLCSLTALIFFLI